MRKLLLALFVLSAMAGVSYAQLDPDDDGIGVYFDDLTYPDMPAHMPRPEQIVAILKQQAVERVASVAAADQD